MAGSGASFVCQLLGHRQQACTGELSRAAQVGLVEPFVVAAKGIPEDTIGTRLGARGHKLPNQG